MKIEYNFDLYSYNTMRLHSIAEIVYFPESKMELQSLVTDLQTQDQKFYILAAGSNVILAEHINCPVICLMKVNNTLTISEDGTVSCGCSVRIQTLIRFLQSNELGGIEYLFSVPTSVGGAVFMNAGRGKSHNKSISDYLFRVEYLDLKTLEIKNFEVNKEMFSHRHSVFQTFPCIIVSADFRFIKQTPEETEKKIKERLRLSKINLDPGKPSCGSVFCKGNPILFRMLKGMKSGGAIFSKKTPNWISNMDNATAGDIRNLVDKAIIWHKLFLSKWKLEIRFFD